MVWRTAAITMTTCFLLGTTFSHWIADHDVLWRSPLTTQAVANSVAYYSFLSSATPGLGWVYIAVCLLGVGSAVGRTFKGARGTRGEVLFDGGSMVLLAGIAYNQISEVYPTINLFPNPLPSDLKDHSTYPALTTAVRDLASDNIMTAVMLTGVMLLQAGRYYAKRSSHGIPAVAESDAANAPSPPAEAIRRVGTPFRELTEEEALELRALDDRGR